MILQGRKLRQPVELKPCDTGALDAEGDARQEAGIITDVAGIEDLHDGIYIDGAVFGSRLRSQRDGLPRQAVRAVAAGRPPVGEPRPEVFGEREREAPAAGDEASDLVDAIQGVDLPRFHVGVQAAGEVVDLFAALGQRLEDPVFVLHAADAEDEGARVVELVQPSYDIVAWDTLAPRDGAHVDVVPLDGFLRVGEYGFALARRFFLREVAVLGRGFVLVRRVFRGDGSDQAESEFECREDDGEWAGSDVVILAELVVDDFETLAIRHADHLLAEEIF